MSIKLTIRLLIVSAIFVSGCSDGKRKKELGYLNILLL